MDPEELPASPPPLPPDYTQTVQPPPPAPWGPWITTLFSIAILAGFLLAQIGVEVTFIGAWMMGHPQGNLHTYAVEIERNGFFIAVATLIGTPVGFGLVLLFARLRKRIALRDYLAFTTARPTVLLAWLGATVVFMVATDSLRTFNGDPLVPEIMQDWYVSSRVPILLWIGFIALAPVFEEAFFRGFLFRGIEASRLGPLGAVLITAVCWSILHIQYNLLGIATIFLFGLILGVARRRTGSLYVCIAMHALNNLVATVETAIVVARAV